MGLQTFGGLDTRSGAANGPKATLATACDFSNGTLTGAATHALQNSASSGTVQGGCMYGTLELVVKGGILYKLEGNAPARTYTQLAAGIHAANNVQMTPYGSVVFIADGSGTLKVWDGTTLAGAGPDTTPAVAPTAVGSTASPLSFITAIPNPLAEGVGTLGIMAAPTVAVLGTGGVVSSDMYMYFCISAVVGGKEQIQSPVSINGAFTLTSDGINISWAAVAGATSYNVYLYRWNRGTYTDGGVYDNNYHCATTDLAVNFKCTSVINTAPHSLAGVSWTGTGVTSSAVLAIPSSRLLVERRDALSATFLATADGTLKTIKVAIWAAPSAPTATSSGGSITPGVDNVIDSTRYPAYTASGFSAKLEVRASPAAFSGTPESGELIYSAQIQIPAANSLSNMATGSMPLLIHSPISTVQVLNGKYYSVTFTPNSSSNKISFLSSVAATTLNWEKNTNWANLGFGPGLLTLSGGAGANMLTGSFSWVYTFYNSTKGTESGPSPISTPDPLVLVNQSATITVPGSAGTGVDFIRIYRSTPAGWVRSTGMKVAIGTTTYIDVAPDSDLTLPLESTGNSPAPSGFKGIVHNPYIGCMMGWKGGVLYLSKQSVLQADLETFPTDSIYYPGDDANVIQNIIMMHGYALMFMKRGVKVVTGSSSTDARFEIVLDAPGLYGSSGVALMKEGCVYVSSIGLILINAGGWQPLLKNELAAEFASGGTFPVSTSSVAGQYGTRFFMCNQSRTLVVDWATGQPEASYDTSISIAKTFWRNAEKLMFGTSGGDVYHADGTPGTKQLLTWQSVVQDDGKPTKLKEYHNLVVDYIGAGTLDITAQDGTTFAQLALSSTPRKIQSVIFPITYGGGIGYDLKLKFIGTNAAFEVYGISWDHHDLLAGSAIGAWTFESGAIDGGDVSQHKEWGILEVYYKGTPTINVVLDGSSSIYSSTLPAATTRRRAQVNLRGNFGHSINISASGAAAGAIYSIKPGAKGMLGGVTV